MSRSAMLMTAVVLTFTAAAPAQVADHVARLGSKSYAEREAASKALDAVGEPALPALRAAAEKGDPETRRRAAALIRAIEHRVESARLLRATTVRLDLKDVTVADAIAEFAKRSGQPIQFGNITPALRERRITLKADGLPFWEALDLLCEKAGLREVRPDSTPGRAVNVNGNSIVIGGNMNAKPKDIRNPTDWNRPTAIVLGDGAARPQPAHTAGAVRLRALEVAGRGTGEYHLKLEAAAEPSLRWHEPLAVRINRAVDDQGQKLEALPVSLPRPKPPAPANRGVVIVNGQVVSGDDGPRPADPIIPLRFKEGTKPSRSLAELSGTVTALLHSAPEALVTIDDVLKAEGREFRGGGGFVSVAEVKQLAGGDVRVRVLVEAPPRELTDGLSQQPLLNMNIIINGRPIGDRDDGLTASHFELLDARGRTMMVTEAFSTGKRSGQAREYLLTYRPFDEKAAPARFVYRDRRTVLVEIPFTLKNVPLQ